MNHHSRQSPLHADAYSAIYEGIYLANIIFYDEDELEELDIDVAPAPDTRKDHTIPQA